jgi:hypothetical protein
LDKEFPEAMTVLRPEPNEDNWYFTKIIKRVKSRPKKNPSIEKHFTSGWRDNGLTDRRKKEFALYSSGDYVPYNA